MEGLRVIKKPRLRNPYLIVAWPGMGEVAFKAASYLVDKLKAEDLAEIPSEEFFYLTASVVKDGVLSVPELPQSKFYYWRNKTGKNDLIIFLSNAQPDLIQAESYCRRIVNLAKHYRVKTVIGFAAMPQPTEHTQDSNVWGVATSNDIGQMLKKHDINIMTEGQISGMNGLFLGIAKREGYQGFCLLGEIPLYTIQIENPKAASAVLDALVKIIDIKIDLTELREQAQSMEAEINKLLDFLKLGGQAPGPINEEDIEKIKSILSQLGNLPLSVKEKIEKLFSQAKADISKANELKVELDKWNVYREYEDRFLDLFKKPKGNNN